MQQLLRKSLSNYDIMNAMHNQCRILTYHQLSKYKSLSNVFGPYDSVFILYETRRNYGHWCVLTQNNNRITFFDSYGMFPDLELKWTSNAFRKSHNMMLPHLTYLLYHDRSGKQLHYNNVALQRMDSRIATCGRWCVLWAKLHWDLTVEQFAQHFKHYTSNPDEHATKLTYDI